MEANEFVEPQGGYGRIWQSVYTGSMVGSGPEVYCLWPYVIANMRKQPQVGVAVDLNPRLLAAVFGVEEGFVQKGIEKLCAVDEASKNGVEEEGRRLVHVSGVMYRVVNGPGYMSVRSRESHAAAQAKYREKLKAGKSPRKRAARVAGDSEARERRFVKAVERGDEPEADRIVAEGLPGEEEA